MTKVLVTLFAGMHFAVLFAEGAFPPAEGLLHFVKNSNMCLTVRGGDGGPGEGAGNGLGLAPCQHDNPWFQFILTAGEGGTGQIQWAKHPDRCLTVMAAGGGNPWGSPIQIQPCTDESDQFTTTSGPQGGLVTWAGHDNSCFNIFQSDTHLQIQGCYPDNGFILDMWPGPTTTSMTRTTHTTTSSTKTTMTTTSITTITTTTMTTTTMTTTTRTSTTMTTQTITSITTTGSTRTATSNTMTSMTRTSTTTSSRNDFDARSPHGASMAFVHLFEWSWDDVAMECEEFLGPKGFTAVQVSPPNEHIKGDAWWTRYQPVSYNLTSRSGNETGFRNMVARCREAGVGVYFDAVINHMAGGSGSGIAGSSFTARDFPQFSPHEFHHDPQDLMRNCEVSNYMDKYNVQYCDLVGLADLCTGCQKTQETIAAYLNNVAETGMAGFRIDAAKHMDPKELGGILDRVHADLFKFQEVISGDAVKPEWYTDMGRVTEFNYARKLDANFKEQYKLKYLDSFGEAWGLLPRDDVVVFIDNHDTQRGHAGDSQLTYKDGEVYKLATIFMLAHPYGYPKVMSSYYFDNTDQGPPKKRVHRSNGVNCGDGNSWVCEHRWPAVANMVAWRKSAGPGLVTDWQAQGPETIAFCRGEAACIAFNRNEGAAWSASFKVSMPPGEYCNVAAAKESGCERVKVGKDGVVSVVVPALSAVAIHINAEAPVLIMLTV